MKIIRKPAHVLEIPCVKNLTVMLLTFAGQIGGLRTDRIQTDKVMTDMTEEDRVLRDGPDRQRYRAYAPELLGSEVPRLLGSWAPRILYRI